MLGLLVVQLLGGLGIFLFGMQYTSQGLQQLAARRMQQVLATLTKNRVTAVLVGIVITVLLQSSSAATVLLVGFVSARLLTLEQALAVVLGSAIGTTVTVQIISFKVTDYALLVVAAGALLTVFGSRHWWRRLGQVLLGFGLLFYGMGLMSDAMEPLKAYPGIVGLLSRLVSHPLLSIAVATVFTAVVQSSAATIALAMSLGSQGVIGLQEALALMLGANIGTTATALISSLASGREAKRLAVGHFLVKAVGVMVILPFLMPFEQLAMLTSTDLGRQVANAHSIFNIFIMFLFIPFTRLGAGLMKKILPDREEDLGVKYLDRQYLEFPDMALAQTKNELLRMAAIIQNEMLPKLLEKARKGKEEELEVVERWEESLDYLYQAITKYLSQMARGDLNEEQAETEVRLLYITNDLEHLGDIIIGMVRMSHKMRLEGITFSPEGWEELEEMYRQVQDYLVMAFKAFAKDDEQLARQVIKGRPEIIRLEKRLRYSHFARLKRDNQVTLESSSYHLDMVNNILRLHSHAVDIAQTVMGII